MPTPTAGFARPWGRHAQRVRRGTLSLVTESSPAPDQQPDPTDEVDLEVLVGDWLTVPDVASATGLRLSDVRRLIEDRELLARRIGERRVVAVPAAFLQGGAPLAALKGTFTVLADGGMSDEEILRWLFTADASWPVPGAAIDAMRAGHKTEVRRRAMEEAF